MNKAPGNVGMGREVRAAIGRYQECTVDISGAEQVDVGLMQNKWWDGISGGGGGSQFRASLGERENGLEKRNQKE